MPTPIDRAMQSRNTFLGFAGLIAAAAAWSIWGGDMFPQEQEATGDPQDWTDSELRRWLRVRNFYPDNKATRDELVQRVKANLRPPPRS